MMQTWWRRRRSTAAHERGAVAVEAALVTTFLLIPLVLGILEFSFVMRDYVAVTSASRSAARMASASAGAGPQVCDSGETGTECSNTAAPELAKLAANAIQTQSSALNKDQINYILVYKADAAGYPGTRTSWSSAKDPATNVDNGPLNDCISAGTCVSYKWLKASDKFKFSAGSWNSTTINACVSGSDSVGVYINSLHPYLTGMFGSTVTISDRTVMRFEPLNVENCGAGAHR